MAFGLGDILQTLQQGVQAINALSVQISNTFLGVAAGQIPGTTTNDNAAAGKVGEQISSTIVDGSAVAIGNSGTANITSISLTPGDWEVTAIVHIVAPNVANVLSWYGGGISTVSGVVPLPQTGTQATVQTWVNAAGNTLPRLSSVMGPLRQSLAATTTVYLVGELGSFAGGNVSFYGTIRARRAR